MNIDLLHDLFKDLNWTDKKLIEEFINMYINDLSDIFNKIIVKLKKLKKV